MPSTATATAATQTATTTTATEKPPQKSKRQLTSRNRRITRQLSKNAYVVVVGDEQSEGKCNTATEILKQENLKPQQQQQQNNETQKQKISEEKNALPFIQKNVNVQPINSPPLLKEICTTTINTSRSKYTIKTITTTLPTTTNHNKNNSNLTITATTTTPMNRSHNNNNNNNTNFYYYYKRFLLLLLLAILPLLLFLLLVGNLPIAACGTNPRVAYRPPNTSPGECRSIDIRNDCNSIHQLTNCTVVRGYVIFFLRPMTSGDSEFCDYTNITFPLLREITDFLIMFDCRGLRTTRDIFPNLTVIRGRRLFMNYALGISLMPELEEVEFKSLIAIEHGHVYIDGPNICNLNKINWDRITLSVGENHIFPPPPEVCANEVVCQGCATQYCWTNETCQHFENENLIAPNLGIQHCHEECLGGCYNSSSNGCLLCRHLSDHGACVKECPAGKYLIEAYQNCTTAEECLSLNMTTKGKECTFNCRKGYIVAYNAEEKLACVRCETRFIDDVHHIDSLAEANRIRGCAFINASIVISIRNEVNEDDLNDSLSSLRIIRGYLKIYRSYGLKSLKFLSGLVSVGSEPKYLEAGVYALIIYDNENLTELWQPQSKFEVVYGSMYLHLNSKLCNQKVQDFVRSVTHDRSKDVVQVNDQEVLCDPAKLFLSTEVLSHRSVRFAWPAANTDDQVELLYRPIQDNGDYQEHSELDTDICKRIQWTRLLLTKEDLIATQDNNNSFIVHDMKPHTRYVCIVKTFGPDTRQITRSELAYIKTRSDLPAPPTINVTKKNDISITVLLKATPADMVSHYILEVFEIPDDREALDRRDFCLQPMYTYHMEELINADTEDLDSCCSRLDEVKDSERFRQNMGDLYKCSADLRENCAPEGRAEKLKRRVLRLQVNAQQEHSVILRNLDRYHLYTLQARSCNSAGCGTYTFYPIRTAATPSIEHLNNLRACRVINTTEFHVHFKEPKQTNGLIVSYVVHFRLKLVAAAQQVAAGMPRRKYRNHIECVTRLQHQYNNHHFIGQLKAPFNEVAVRVNAISGSYLTHWVPIPLCSADGKDVYGYDDDDVLGVNALVANVHLRAGTVVILICFIASIVGLSVWSGYKYGCWRNNGVLRRYLTTLWGWQSLRRDEAQQLVEFRNINEDDLLGNASS